MLPNSSPPSMPGWYGIRELWDISAATVVLT
jgi:hypothetical protein